MKLYQMILGVPDDFDPDKMSMNVSYENDKEIKITSEGFIGPEKIVECKPDVEIPQEAADMGIFGNLMGAMMGGMTQRTDDLNSSVEDANINEVEEEGNSKEGTNSSSSDNADEEE